MMQTRVPARNYPGDAEMDAMDDIGEELVTSAQVDASNPHFRVDVLCGSAESHAAYSVGTKQPPLRTMFPTSAPALVRSYSTADPTNEAFTVTHELDFDDWMSTMIGTTQLVLSSSVVALGIYLLFTCPEMSEEGPLLFYFVVFSLSAELALLVLICSLILALRLFCGQARAEYSSAVCGIFHRTMEGAIYFLCVGFGASLLLLLATGDADDPRVRYMRKRREFVWAFVGLEVALCLLYCLQTIPTLYGICKFASHKLYLKFSGRDELEFQRGDVPIAYAPLSEYDYSLQHMHNPAARGRGYDPLTDQGVSIHTREGEQPKRSSAEAPLLNDRV